MKNVQDYFDNVKSYKLMANKSLGQNFLINPQVAESISKTLDISKDDNVLEIGAGLGSLSYFLVKNDANVRLIDIDERMLMFLTENYSSLKNVEIKRQNVLKEGLTSFTKICGNLPYYITSSIIEHILLNARNAKKITLMTQKEVYPKLLKNYSSPLSIFLNYVCEISNANIVGKTNFAPVPHVESCYFTLTPNENIKNEDNKTLYKLICKMFLLRRKNVLNCLTNILKDKDLSRNILEQLDIDINLRPEQLDINFYLKLHLLLKSKDLMNRI